MQSNTKTYEQQILPFGKTVSTSLPEDFPASRSASQENAKERKTPAICGPQCSVSFGLFDRDGSLARMFTESLIGRRDWSSNRCALTWRKQDTRCSRTLYRLAVSALPTVGTDAGLLPTVQTQGLKRCVNGRTEFMPTVLLPTPHASDASRGGQKVTGLYKTRKSGLTYMSLLNDLAVSGLLPTPDSERCEECNASCQSGHTQGRTTQEGDAKRRIPDWNGFPTQPPVCGGDDGFPGELVGIAFPRWRREAVKACGNAIVPQVALHIFETINEYEKI